MTPDRGATPTPLLQVNDLVKHFPVRGRGPAQMLRAVDGVSFTVNAGETVGVVGESGCGKSTVARLVVGLTKPTSGSVLVEGGDIWARGKEGAERRRRMQMVFQNPTGSMNPRRTVGDAVAEPLQVLRAPGIRAKVEETLSLVGLKPEMADRMPHEMSGGQQQRAAIARAMISNPALVVHDESVASLDISLQAQILNLLVDLQDRLGTAYLFISHDLAAVQAISHRVVVMYLGEVVESATAVEFAARPLHPYSVALRRAALLPDPEIEQSRVEVGLTGDVPSPLNPPSGCRFRTRCPYAEQKCADEKPALRPAQDGHYVACHFAGIATATTALEGAS
ncbi:ABC transporter ATP-binding protein [Knoellia koreensis]|uniref:ATP-binding cassette domain-containing protein n=1 Tax=Knoellia koreensis TaxID=2730921 RepID=A0A849HK84_9MICO|nr:oligopeptide/dipeptide ABC transporter ATP-binding protein [Knoellia sp. DB2414S]NNM47712.1 ATP-binding cassette domain-containing protein [Knoellia sp. DB2414S]